MGFEALEIEPTNAVSDEEDEGAAIDVSDAPELEGSAAAEEDMLFAVACLMADAARTREEVSSAWAEWAPAAEHCASLLGAASRASFAVAKLERVVNATLLTLGQPDDSAMLLAAFGPPRVRLRGLQAKPELNGRVGVLGSRDPQSGRYTVTLDGTDEGAPPIKAKPSNLCGEQWLGSHIGCPPRRSAAGWSRPCRL
jgi:hypothetical protein